MEHGLHGHYISHTRKSQLLLRLLGCLIEGQRAQAFIESVVVQLQALHNCGASVYTGGYPKLGLVPYLLHLERAHPFVCA